MRIKLLSVLTWVFFLHLGITSSAQTVKTKESNPTAPTNLNFPYWLTTGNTGTNASVNFIGTRDAQPLVFRVNNQKAGYLDYSEYNLNTAFGYRALNANIVSDSGGRFTSAFGAGALSSNTTGWGNTAHGTGALSSNTTGSINTAVGGETLISNKTGGFNTAIGYNALYSNEDGSFNTATGDYTLFSNTIGNANIANGAAFTLTGNTEGSFNIATGVLALTNNTTGNANIAYGSFSLASNITGNSNTAIGDQADVTATDLNNATAIGAGALVDASNKVRIGNTEVTSIGGEVGWTSFSDERIKDNVKENVPGLEFIKALRPVTYHFNVAKENALLGRKDITAKVAVSQSRTKLPGAKGLQTPALDMINQKIKSIPEEHNYELEKVQFTGFLAQDVDKAARKIGYDFSGIDKSGKIMGLRYSDFVVPLVKAVQQLSQMNEEKDARIDGLQKQIDELRVLISNNNLKSGVTLNDASLEQNMPNPFNKTTVIGYTLPEKFVNAEIIIIDKSGKVLKHVNVSSIRKGTVNVDATTLPSGAYSYSLIVDGRLIGSKQMVLTK